MVHKYGAQRYCEQMINVSDFYDLMGSKRNLWETVAVDYLRIYI